MHKLIEKKTELNHKCRELESLKLAKEAELTNYKISLKGIRQKQFEAEKSLNELKAVAVQNTM